MAKVGLFKAYAELRNVLETINGSTGGYWLNFGGRVYNTLILPNDEGAGKEMPYLCLPRVEENLVLAAEGNGIRLRFQQPIFVFAADESTEEGESKGAEQVDKAFDDILRAVRKNPTLNDTVQNCEVTSGGRADAGVSPEDDWAERVVVVEMELVLNPEIDLGP